MHGGETAPGFNAPPSLCWSLRGVGPHPGGQPSSASPSTVHVLLLLLWVLRPTAPSRCQPRGGEAPSPKRELDPQNRLCCRSGRRPRTFVPPASSNRNPHTNPIPMHGDQGRAQPRVLSLLCMGCNGEPSRAKLQRGTQALCSSPLVGAGFVAHPSSPNRAKVGSCAVEELKGSRAQNAHSCSRCPTLRCLGFWSQRCSGFPYERHSEQTAKSRTDLCLEDAKDLAFVCH